MFLKNTLSSQTIISFFTPEYTMQNIIMLTIIKLAITLLAIVPPLSPVYAVPFKNWS